MAPPNVSEWSDRIVIPSTYTDAQRVIDEILQRLREAGWHQDDIFAVHIALEESLSNAVKHGNRGDPTKRVTVHYLLDAEHIELSVADEGQGFDPSTVPDPTQPEHIDAPSGRGLCLIRGFMDEVHFADGGRRIVMSRRRRHPGRSPTA